VTIERPRPTGVLRMTTKPRSTARGLAGDVEGPAQRLRHAGGVALLRQRVRANAVQQRAQGRAGLAFLRRRQHLLGERDCLVGPPLEHGELGGARLRLEHVAARANLVEEEPAATRRS
jgi:hypothetical protein